MVSEGQGEHSPVRCLFLMCLMTAAEGHRAEARTTLFFCGLPSGCSLSYSERDSRGLGGVNRGAEVESWSKSEGEQPEGLRWAGRAGGRAVRSGVQMAGLG